MSTQEIGKLLDSVNDLTQTVAGKMSEIDKKVIEATASVPNTIRSLSEQSLHVDAINGSDDNSGTSSFPLKTIDAAIDKCLPSMKATILVMEGQRHVMRVGKGRHWPKANNRSLYIAAYGSSPDSIKATITAQVTQPGESLDGYYTASGFEGDKLSVVFINCIIETGRLPSADATAKPYGNGDLASSTFGGLVSRSTTAGGELFGSVMLYKSVVKIQDFPLFTSQYGFLSISLAATSVEKDGSCDFVAGGQFNRSVSVIGSTFSGFTDNTVDVLFGNNADNSLKTVV
ncbi:TPA: hypothetical protein NGS29_002921 [Vibrio parahaemolyticus]|nr:hypothetical protein [Vibrio parahaemolyticus]HCG6304785.1 hypothetical protein [Vibrio parahaemolyticus]